MILVWNVTGVHMNDFFCMWSCSSFLTQIQSGSQEVSFSWRVNEWPFLHSVISNITGALWLQNDEAMAFLKAKVTGGLGLIDIAVLTVLNVSQSLSLSQTGECSFARSSDQYHEPSWRTGSDRTGQDRTGPDQAK